MTKLARPNIPVEEDEEYQDVTAALRLALTNSQFKAGGYFLQMRQRKDYGRYPTFADYVVGEFRLNKTVAHRLIFAHRFNELCQERKLPRPTSERQIPFYR
jgi:hypothetical protein